MSFHKSMISVLVVVALAACGGGKSASSSTAASAAPVASTMGGAMSSMKGAMQAGMSADAASLSCGAMKPVWVNMATHVYHEPNDPYYGKTKHGGFMCPSAAAKAGYHAAGAGKRAMHGKHAGATMGTPSSDGDTDGD